VKNGFDEKISQNSWILFFEKCLSQNEKNAKKKCQKSSKKVYFLACQHGFVKNWKKYGRKL